MANNAIKFLLSLHTVCMSGDAFSAHIYVELEATYLMLCITFLAKLRDCFRFGFALPLVSLGFALSLGLP